MIELQNIPEQVKLEIAETYPDADYSQYGTIDGETISRKLKYRVYEPLEGQKEIIDPLTFDPKIVDETTHRYITGYIVRLNGLSIRSVVTIGPAVGEIPAD